MGEREQAALSTAHAAAETQVRERTTRFVTAVWDGLGSWRDGDVARFVSTVAPVVAGAQRQIGSLTDAYLAAMLGDMLGEPRRPIGVEPLTGGTVRAGVDPSEEYGRPFRTVWAALAEGMPLADALASGRRRAQQLAATDLQLAKTHTALAVLSGDERVVGFRRVLKGTKSCGLCVVAATQRYHKERLMPIHPGCDCGVAPLVGTEDPGQVLDQDLLDRAHAQVKERFGAFDPTARDKLDYRDLIVTHEHGELGPVLARKGDHFTGPADLGKTFTAPAREVVEAVRRGDPLKGIDLTKLSYEEIASLYEQHAEDEIAGASLLAEVERRELVDQAAKAAAERNEFDTDDVDGWLAEGEELDAILENNGWGGAGAPDAWRDEINPSRGKNASEQSRDLYDEWVYTQYLHAEADTRGVLLNKAGVAAGIDPTSLFSGPSARARKYASEELLRWWGDHQRLTLTEFRAQHLGRASDKKAAQRTREGSSGREFGI